MKTAVKEDRKPKKKKKAKRIEQEDSGIFGGDDAEKGDDPYNYDGISREDLLTLDSFAEEERKAFASPLKASEMKKMEASGDALFKEITAGLKGVSEDEY